jgi:DNA-binding response OmpR family regulator
MLDPTLVKILVASEPQVAREILLKRLRVAMAWMRLPVVIIIPGKDKRLAKILEEHGVADYLIKPFAAEALMERITSVMRR